MVEVIVDKLSSTTVLAVAKRTAEMSSDISKLTTALRELIPCEPDDTEEN
jgi:hypothetical protein